MPSRLIIVTGVAALLLAACSSTDPGATPGSTAPSVTASAGTSPTDLGSLYVSSWGDDARTIQRYPIRSDGSLGAVIEVLTGPADDIEFPGAIDGLGADALTGSFDTYWTTALQVRDTDSGTQTSQTTAARWCGGEGLTSNACALLDPSRVARTGVLGDPSGTDPTITISELGSGQTLAEYGPFPGLTNILGTTDPDTLLLLVSDDEPSDPPRADSGTVSALDVTTGDTTEIGAYPQDWAPLCAVGTTGVLGYSVTDPPTASGIGEIGPTNATWATDDTPVGCTADGQYVYVQRISGPPTGEEDDDPPGEATALMRISVADGSSQQVLALPPGTYADLVTR